MHATGPRRLFGHRGCAYVDVLVRPLGRVSGHRGSTQGPGRRTGGAPRRREGADEVIREGARRQRSAVRVGSPRGPVPARRAAGAGSGGRCHRWSPRPRPPTASRRPPVPPRWCAPCRRAEGGRTVEAGNAGGRRRSRPGHRGPARAPGSTRALSPEVVRCRLDATKTPCGTGQRAGVAHRPRAFVTQHNRPPLAVRHTGPGPGAGKAVRADPAGERLAADGGSVCGGPLSTPSSPSSVHSPGAAGIRPSG
jgi:hypothetical protein